jgi:CRP/FNR family transcriptional regulator, cyclic AMP receptor protein
VTGGDQHLDLVSRQLESCLDGVERCGAFTSQLLERDTADKEFYVAAIPAGRRAKVGARPRITRSASAPLLNRNSRIEEDLIDQLFNSSEKRLARVLLLLANFGKEATTEPIIGKFSQETLAEMIGTTRSRVSFFMSKFRKLGYIEYNGKLEIRNSLLNSFCTTSLRSGNGT